MPFQTEKLFQNEERSVFWRRLLRRVFLEDWLLKALALLITFALWLGVTGLRAPGTRRLDGIPLNIRVSDDIEITNSLVQEIDLKITGDKRKIEQINTRDLVVSLDLTDVPAGDRAVQLTPENVSLELPTGVRLTEVQPSKIAVNLERVEERAIAVRAETEGSVPDNFEVYSETVSPLKVRVRGPESSVKSLDFISTEKISVENQQSDFIVQRVALNITNPKITPLDTTVVDVAFRVGEKRIERMFSVRVAGENKRVSVVLYGARSVLESLKPEDLRVESVKTETGEISLNLTLPGEVQSMVEIRKLQLSQR